MWHVACGMWRGRGFFLLVASGGGGGAAAAAPAPPFQLQRSRDDVRGPVSESKALSYGGGPCGCLSERREETEDRDEAYGDRMGTPDPTT